MMRYMSFSLVISSASYKPAAKLPSEPCWVLSSIAVSQSYNPLWHEKFFRIILAKCVYKWSYTSDVPFAHIKGSILSLPGASVCSQVQSQGESNSTYVTGTLTLIPAPWLRTTQVQSSSQLWSSQCRPDTSRWGNLKNLWPVLPLLLEDKLQCCCLACLHWCCTWVSTWEKLSGEVWFLVFVF